MSLQLIVFIDFTDMAARTFNKINACDGFMCGSIIKKGSLPVDRIDSDELKEFIKEYQGNSYNEEWTQEWIKNILNTIDEEWMKEFICSHNCETGEGDFTLEPPTLTFEAIGGKQTLKVVTDAKTAWTVLR